MEFSRLDLSHPEVEFSGASFDVEGKRGLVTLNFTFKEDGQVVGKGMKRMVASGLKPYDQSAIDGLVERFDDRKQAFLASLSNAA